MKGIIKLVSYCFLLFIFFAYVGPFIVSLSPTWVRYNQVLEENDIPGGAYYYTELPFIEDAEKHVNKAVEEGMELRRQRREQEN